MAGTSKQPRDISDVNNSYSLSLAAAIFTPFVGLPSPVNSTNTTPPTRCERLQRMIASLDTQHAAVRQHMLFLTTLEKERIISEARAELLAEFHGNETADRRSRRESSRISWVEKGNGEEWLKNNEEDLFERLRGPAKKDQHGGWSKSYQADFSDGATKAIEHRVESILGLNGPRDGDGDIDMDDAPPNAAIGPKKANGKTRQTRVDIIRESTATVLRELVYSAKEQLDAYDTQVANTRKKYMRALEKSSGKVDDGYTGQGQEIGRDDMVGTPGGNASEISSTTSTIVGGASDAEAQGQGSAVKRSGVVASEPMLARRKSLHYVDSSRDPRSREKKAPDVVLGTLVYK